MMRATLSSILPGISPVVPSEAAAEADLVDRAFAAGPYGHLPKDAERRALEGDAAGRAASGAVLVARQANRVVGTSSVLRAGTPYARVAAAGEAEIRLLAVDPGVQGAGLGEALVRASLETALEWGAEALVLDTGTDNLRAQALYERIGFERDPSRDQLASADGVESVVFCFPLQQRADVRVRLMRDDEAAEVSALAQSAYADDFPLTEGYRAEIAAVAERARDHQVWVATDAASGMLLGTTRPRAPGGRSRRWRATASWTSGSWASRPARAGAAFAPCSWTTSYCSRGSAASHASS